MNLANVVILLLVSIFFALAGTNVLGQTPTDSKFDLALQKEFEKGVAGDEAALSRAMQRAEKILAANPQDAESLVWRGSASLVLAGNAYRSGNFAEGGKFWQKGLQEMDDAVKFAPDNFKVRYVRGATVLSAAKNFPDPATSKTLREKGIADYERLLSSTGEQSQKMLVSERSKILTALVQAYEKAGDKAKADFYKQQLSESKN